MSVLKPTVPAMLTTEQIKKAKENVMTIFDIAGEEPAMEPAVPHSGKAYKD